MKSSIFVLLSVALLSVPRPSSAASIKSVDNSDYGIQSFGTACSGFTDSSGMNADCFFSQFSNGYYGLLVGFDSTVSDVEVAFSNANIFDTGLVICDSTDPGNDCGQTPTWDLDVSTHADYTTLFSSTIGPTSAVYDLNGTVLASNTHGNEVAFLLLCSPTDPTGAPGRTDCDGVDVTVRSLAATNPVPEPASLLLCGSGAAMVARRLRNRRSAR